MVSESENEIAAEIATLHVAEIEIVPPTGAPAFRRTHRPAELTNTTQVHWHSVWHVEASRRPHRQRVPTQCSARVTHSAAAAAAGPTGHTQARRPSCRAPAVNVAPSHRPLTAPSMPPHCPLAAYPCAPTCDAPTCDTPPPLISLAPMATPTMHAAAWPP